MPLFITNTPRFGAVAVVLGSFFSLHVSVLCCTLNPKWLSVLMVLMMLHTHLTCDDMLYAAAVCSPQLHTQVLHLAQWG
jgi:hypothetical protein